MGVKERICPDAVALLERAGWKWEQRTYTFIGPDGVSEIPFGKLDFHYLTNDANARSQERGMRWLVQEMNRDRQP